MGSIAPAGAPKKERVNLWQAFDRTAEHSTAAHAGDSKIG